MLCVCFRDSFINTWGEIAHMLLNTRGRDWQAAAAHPTLRRYFQCHGRACKPILLCERKIAPSTWWYLQKSSWLHQHASLRALRADVSVIACHAVATVDETA